LFFFRFGTADVNHRPPCLDLFFGFPFPLPTQTSLFFPGNNPSKDQTPSFPFAALSFPLWRRERTPQFFIHPSTSPFFPENFSPSPSTDPPPVTRLFTEVAHPRYLVYVLVPFFLPARHPFPALFSYSTEDPNSFPLMLQIRASIPHRILPPLVVRRTFFLLA